MVRQPYHVIVVGAGAAGLACAITTAGLGLRTLVLEKAQCVGTGTSVSAGLIWIGANHLGSMAGDVDKPAEVADYLRYVGAMGLDHARMVAFVDEAPRALSFFEATGIPFRLTTFSDQYYGVAPGAKAKGRIVETVPISAEDMRAWDIKVARPSSDLYRRGSAATINRDNASPQAFREDVETADVRTAGPGLISWLLKIAVERGVTICIGSEVDRLETDADRITGVKLASGRTIEALCGVVIASGGYESNLRLSWDLEGLPGWRSMFPPTITGDGLVMACEAGAALKIVANNLAIFLGFHVPDGRSVGNEPCHLAGIKELLSPHTIVVNRDGCRFADETFFQAMVPALRAFDLKKRSMQNLPCYLIFDQQFARTRSFGVSPPGQPIPAGVPRSHSVQGLASELGINAEGLAITIEHFNAAVRAGRDGEFRRGEASWGVGYAGGGQTLGTVECAPFYGVELCPTGLSSAGLSCDAAARVLNMRGRPIPGLFAIGNAAARTETGSGYQAGFSLGSALTYGFIAGTELQRIRETMKH
jgi:3-oxosteroid 1-dehydrogenase